LRSERDIKRIARSLALLERVAEGTGMSGRNLEMLQLLARDVRAGITRAIGVGDLRPWRGRPGRISKSWKYNVRQIRKYIASLYPASMAIASALDEASVALTLMETLLAEHHGKQDLAIPVEQQVEMEATA
jgi:hypothetical protein